MPQETITAEQWAAARMLVARLRSEASQQEFDFADLGITWVQNNDPICATVDDGTMIRTSDLLYANVVLMWTLVIDRATYEGVEAAEIVNRLGLGLADMEA